MKRTLLCVLPAALSAACIVVVVPGHREHAPARMEAEEEEAGGDEVPPAPASAPHVSAAEPAEGEDEPPRAPAEPPSDDAARAALASARAWLAGAQLEDGSWPHERPAGAASPMPREVGVTALAVLALLESDEHAGAARRGVEWLRARQDPDTGLIGRQVGTDFLYGHAIGTLALIRAAGDDADARADVQEAVHVIHAARNPYGAWRYHLPPVGDNDTSVTGWMLAALDAAREEGYAVDDAALQGGIEWIDEVTDPATGRVGYDSFGSLSSRTPANEHYPRDRGEAMTAIGLASRIEVQEAGFTPIAERHARLLKRTLPEWDAEGLGVDMYYWYHGTRAMRAAGGEDWRVWRAALLSATVPHQDPDGSWDPIGPWGYAGGRAFATALMAMSLAECLDG